MTSDDDTEIMECLNLVLKASPLGLVHESINVNRIHDYTRSWFACKAGPRLGNENTNRNRGEQCFCADYIGFSEPETAFDLWERRGTLCH